MSRFVILRHAVAVKVHLAEVELGFGFTLLGGNAGPLQGLGVILGHATALSVHDTEVELG